jgi:hypothetical protein
MYSVRLMMHSSQDRRANHSLTTLLHLECTTAFRIIEQWVYVSTT